LARFSDPPADNVFLRSFSGHKERVPSE